MVSNYCVHYIGHYGEFSNAVVWCVLNICIYLYIVVLNYNYSGMHLH